MLYIPYNIDQYGLIALHLVLSFFNLTEAAGVVPMCVCVSFACAGISFPFTFFFVHACKELWEVSLHALLKAGQSVAVQQHIYM